LIGEKESFLDMQLRCTGSKDRPLKIALYELGLNIYIVLIIRKKKRNIPKNVFFKKFIVYNRNWK